MSGAMPMPNPDEFPYLPLSQELIDEYLNDLDKIGGVALRSKGIEAIDLYNSRKIEALWREIDEIKARLKPTPSRVKLSQIGSTAFDCAGNCSFVYAVTQDLLKYAVCLLGCLLLRVHAMEKKKRKKG